MRYLNDNVLDFFLFQSMEEIKLTSVTEPGLKTAPRACLQSPVIWFICSTKQATVKSPKSSFHSYASPQPYQHCWWQLRREINTKCWQYYRDELENRVWGQDQLVGVTGSQGRQVVCSTTEGNAFTHVFFNRVLIGQWVYRTKKQQRMWLGVLADVKPKAWNKMKAGLLWPLAVISNRIGTSGGQATLL